MIKKTLTDIDASAKLNTGGNSSSPKLKGTQSGSGIYKWNMSTTQPFKKDPYPSKLGSETPW